MTVVPSQPAPAHAPRTPWRWALALAGLACFALGAVGALVPGLPTTVFLLVGSYCLARSCPWLEQRLLSTRLLRPYASLVLSREPLSRRARFTALGAMTACVALSIVVLALSDRLTTLIAAIIGGLWIMGVVCILLFRRARAQTP